MHSTFGAICAKPNRRAPPLRPNLASTCISGIRPIATPCLLGQPSRNCSNEPTHQACRSWRRNVRRQHGDGRRHVLRIREFRRAPDWRQRIDAEFPRLDFNDRARSAIIEGGPWEVCVGTNFDNDCTVLAPGRYPNSRQVVAPRSARRGRHRRRSATCNRRPSCRRCPAR